MTSYQTSLVSLIAKFASNGDDFAERSLALLFGFA